MQQHWWVLFSSKLSVLHLQCSKEYKPREFIVSIINIYIYDYIYLTLISGQINIFNSILLLVLLFMLGKKARAEVRIGHPGGHLIFSLSWDFVLNQKCHMQSYTYWCQFFIGQFRRSAAVSISYLFPRFVQIHHISIFFPYSYFGCKTSDIYMHSYLVPPVTVVLTFRCTV